MSARPRLLIISFSPIVGDARVLKQVRLFADDYDVVTCGYGDTPDGVVEHIRIPDGVRHNDLNGRLITAKLYTRVYWSVSSVRWAREHLERGAYDIVFANEVDAVPLGLWLDPRGGVHADLHEYHPLVNEELPLWAKRIRPYVEWQCRRYVAKASSWSAASAGFAAEYERVFGFRPEPVLNATPFRDAEPVPVGNPLRLVHSGACRRARHLGETIEGVIRSSSGATLDLFLTPNDPAHLEELRELAATSDGRVTIHDPVPYRDLVDTLAGYDVGVTVLPPVNFSYEWSLPNKLFDYVQARLAVVIGPSPESERVVRRYGFGVVAASFAAADIAAAIDSLTQHSVAEMKAAAHEHAHELAAGTEVGKWKTAVDKLARHLTHA